MTFIKHSNLSEAASHPDAAIARINHDRKPTMITLSTWKALFLREAVSRLSAGPAAWLWLLLEPVLHVTYILVIYTAIRVRAVGGIETAVWLMVGMLAFFMFRRTAAQAMNGIYLAPGKARGLRTGACRPGRLSDNPHLHSSFQRRGAVRPCHYLG